MCQLASAIVADRVDEAGHLGHTSGASGDEATTSGNQPEASVVRPDHQRLKDAQLGDRLGQLRDRVLGRKVRRVDARHREQSHRSALGGSRELLDVVQVVSRAIGLRETFSKPFRCWLFRFIVHIRRRGERAKGWSQVRRNVQVAHEMSAFKIVSSTTKMQLDASATCITQ
jgi:hypothetical protein